MSKSGVKQSHVRMGTIKYLKLGYLGTQFYFLPDMDAGSPRKFCVKADICSLNLIKFGFYLSIFPYWLFTVDMGSQPLRIWINSVTSLMGLSPNSLFCCLLLLYMN